MASSTFVVPRAEVDGLTFEDFYAAEFDRVLDSAFAFSGDRDAAIDATQEAFARAFARWRAIESARVGRALGDHYNS